MTKHSRNIHQYFQIIFSLKTIEYHKLQNHVLASEIKVQFKKAMQKVTKSKVLSETLNIISLQGRSWIPSSPLAMLLTILS